tara:strand:+ start:2904 stop:3284 length:381 start_codon:yes stop_codon:yes gene_type:complete
LPDTISLRERPENPRKALCWLKKATRLSLCGLETPTCLLRKINQHVDQILDQDIPAIPQKINFQPDIGHVRRGSMKTVDVLKLLEKHEEECNRRYADIQRQLDKLDLRLWGIAVLIIAAAIAQRMF